MRYLIAILLLFVSAEVFAANRDSVSVAVAVNELNRALVNKDSLKLNELLTENAHYYHSNGWLELKRDVIDDLFNGKLTYNQVNITLQRVRPMGEIAQARMIADVDVSLNGKTIQLKLKVVQVWVRRGDRWQLYSRHSERI